jgi:hypothetical protein
MCVEGEEDVCVGFEKLSVKFKSMCDIRKSNVGNVSQN